MSAEIANAHQSLIAELRRFARPPRAERQRNDSYGGSGRPFLEVSAPEQRRIVRDWRAAHRDWTGAQELALADSLFAGELHEEKTLAALLLQASAPARRAATPAMVEGWLGRINGWAEVDSLCASVFGPEDLLADWAAWRASIRRLYADADLNKRRGALVLMTRPCRTSDDPAFLQLAFETVDRLKAERDPMITKAVSWLLRSAAARHGAAVEAYLDANKAALPAIAVRETRNKLATGRKSRRA